MTDQKTFDIAKAIEAQKIYSFARALPVFAPSDGKCWKCNKNIYSEGGVSVEKASTELITGCPHCHRSFVD